MKSGTIEDKVEIEKLRKEDDFKEIKISNMQDTMKHLEKDELSMKEKLSQLKNENAGYNKRISEMNSLLTSLLI